MTAVLLSLRRHHRSATLPESGLLREKEFLVIQPDGSSGSSPASQPLLRVVALEIGRERDDHLA
jgi:hypothetical protein